MGLGNNIEINLMLDGKGFPAFFKSEHTPLYPSPESKIAALLLPSMKRSLPVNIPENVDKKFLYSLDQIQDVFTTWDTNFSKIPIKVNSSVEEKIAGEGVGTFFTGGVDSFYTLLKHNDEITHLIYVHGYENHKVTSELKKIGKSFGKEIIELKTNLRDFSDPVVTWHNYFGAALAVVSHLLKTTLKKIFIPSSHTYLDLVPNGSHPLLDPLWSSSKLSIVHDGCEATRVDKVALIANHEIALSHLRVCWKDTEGVHNCGKCEKCIRTMINLKAIGALDKCPTFPNNIPLLKVTGISAQSENIRALVKENIRHLKEGKDNKKLILALWWVLHKPYMAIKLRQLIRKIR